ncbi:MAG: TIGR01620 family protein [Bauldia sp.]|nr:TIGR01620 family protein [Bauldia sp.]
MSQRRRPAAFKLDDVRFEESEAAAERAIESADPVVVRGADPFDLDAIDTLPAGVPAEAGSRRSRLSRWIWIGAGGLVTLALGLAVDQLLRELFARLDWLGWAGVALTVVLVVGLIGLAIRELVGLLRLRRLGTIRELATEAASEDDRKKALDASRQLVALYESRAETARGRAALKGHLAEIIDGRDLVGLAERELILPLDEAARRLILDSAKRVSLVTAISPRALVDIFFVVSEIVRLIRRLASLYGGRPGMLGFIRLSRTVITHLAITGGLAAGDSLVQQLLGQGIAGRISARLGEGVVNGMLTARVGIAAIDVCRPLPFLNGRPPRLGDVLGELTKVAERTNSSAK